jgi:F0F1-type ATP synthase assembly protein I
VSDGPSDRERDERGVGEVGDDSQGAKEQETRSQGAVYQGALEAVSAILIAAGIGYWLDDIFDSAPTGLLIGAVIGFASFTVRLVRLGRYVHGSDADGRPGDRE